MRRLLVPLALAGAFAACSDGGSVDADAIRGPELAAVRTALDSAFLHDTTLDRAFTGDSGFYALMAALVFPFIDRASRIRSEERRVGKECRARGWGGGGEEEVCDGRSSGR